MQNQKKRPRGLKINAGMTLVELLIALVLGMTLAAGVTQIYVGSSATERSQEARLRMQEGGRFGINFLSQEIRMAGYFGCLSSIEGTSANSLLNTDLSMPLHFQPEWGIQGWEAAGTSPGVVNDSTLNVAQVATSPSEWSTGDSNIVMPVFNAVPNSDIVRVWGGTGAAGNVIGIAQGPEPTITVEANEGIGANDFLLISDCERVDIAQACAVEAGQGTTSILSLSSGCVPGNFVGALITSITDTAAPAKVIRLQGTIFYVGKRGDSAENPPALFRAQLDSNGTLATAEELIEGVESMQILYGVNNNEDARRTADTYLTADSVTQWQNVVSVRITLLMQSIDDGIVPQPQGYSFNGVVYDGGELEGGGSLPEDRRVRRIFTTTISLRNRALGV